MGKFVQWLLSKPFQKTETNSKTSSSASIEKEGTYYSRYDFDCEVSRFFVMANDALFNLYGCTHLEHINKYVSELKTAKDELIRLSLDKRFPVSLGNAIKEHKKFGWELSQDAKHLTLNPKSIDVSAIEKERVYDIVANYRPYWESVVGALSRKSAIVKRRQYLVESLNAMIPLLVAYPDLAQELRLYLDFNKERLGEISKNE